MELHREITPMDAVTSRRCVVTGAAGFIGSYLCERLVRDGWSVVGVDAFTDSYDPTEKLMRAARLAQLHGISLVLGDLVDLDLEPVMDGADVVFHLAGRAGVRSSFSLVDRYIHDNVKATESVVAASRNAGVRRLVYASSSSVYGDGEMPFREDAIPTPISPYGQTKLSAECLSLAAAGKGIEAVALRYFTVYGPGQRPDMGLRIFAEAALSGLPITLFGDGSQRRDFTYVTDIVAATVAAADAPVSGSAINVGGGSSVSLLDVFALLRILADRELTVNVEPFAPGDVLATAADLSRAHELLGFRAQVPFEVGFEREVAWVRHRLETTEVRSA
ncbi:MAG: NAD-dependent epimerase/dehydratase family protein [Acidimicrobiales bacterium]